MTLLRGMKNFPHNAIDTVPDQGITITWFYMDITCLEPDCIGNDMIGKFYNRCLFRQNNQVLDIIFFFRGFLIRNDFQKSINICVFAQFTVKVICVKPLNS